MDVVMPTLRNLRKWEKARDAVASRPSEIKGIEHLENIEKVVAQWREGLLLAREAEMYVRWILRPDIHGS